VKKTILIGSDCHSLASLIAAALFWPSAAIAQAFVVENLYWPQGSNVVMQLGFGASSLNLQDGFVTFNASAADAAAIWNGYLDFISFSAVGSAAVPQESGDKVNSAFFARTVFGESFGEGALAVTVLLNSGTTETEADVVVNSNYQFDSYRGPQQTGLYDFHRVILHEFGHVLGLDHVTFSPAGQAIMEPLISDLDHLGPDDVEGISALYAAKITASPGTVYLRPGDTFDYNSFAANNEPTSWSAIGLPAGFSIDAATGHITGVAPASGKFAAVITAYGPIADAYVPFSITVESLNQVPGLLKILPLDAYWIVTDPIRPRVYSAGFFGVDMIDVNTLETTHLCSTTGNAWPPSLSPDASELLLIGAFPNYSVLRRVELDSLAVMPDEVITDGSYEYYTDPLLPGLDGRDYLAGVNDVVQFDDITGVLQKKFASVANHPQLAMSPDRKTLFVTDSGYPVASPSFSSYDISTPEPVLLQHTDTSYGRLTYTSDGETLYGLEGTADPIVQIDPLNLQKVASFGETSGIFISLALAPKGSIYTLEQPTVTGSGSWQAWDPVSLQQTALSKFENLSPTKDINSYDFRSYVPVNFALDSTGKYLFCVNFLYPGIPSSREVWVFSTDLAAFPPPPVPTRNLANISTRVNVNTGDGVMIGGFIIDGATPKKVLLRALGPSLSLTGALGDPVLSLYDSSGTQIVTNDNWTTNRIAILGSSLAPTSERESAILITLTPGSYTAVVEDHNRQPGLALVEVYDLDVAQSALANISTRGEVGAGDDVMIGGFIVGGQDPTELLVRGIGPSLSKNGIAFPLGNPVLEIHDASGTIIMSNDDWRATQQSEITATGLQPSNDLESAVLLTVTPGAYTAIVRGQNNSTGVALVEVYNLDANSTAK
jgi:Matrixin